MIMYGERYFSFVQRLLLSLFLITFVLWITWPALHPDTIPQETILQESAARVPVMASYQGEFGNIRISTQGGLTLGYAYLLINGEAVGDFGTGSLTVRVYPGDILELDCQLYDKAVHFSVEALSASINKDYLLEMVSCYGDISKVGVIVFH